MSFQAVLAITMINMLGMRATRVLTPLFAIELGANPFVIGVLAAMESIFPLLLALYAGALADRLGARRPMMLGSLGMAGGFTIPWLLPSITGLYISCILIGFAHVFYNVSLQNLVGRLGTAETRTKNFSNYTLALSIGSLLGPLAAGFAIDVVGHARGYLLASLMPLLAVAFIASQPKEQPRAAPPLSGTTRGGAMELWRIAPLRRIFVLGGVLLAAIDLFLFYLPIYAHSLGLSASAIGIVLSAFSLASFIVRVMVPGLARRLGELGLLGYALLISAAIFACVPFIRDPWLLGLASFGAGFALGCGMPLSMTLIYAHSPPGRSGAALGFRVAFNNTMHIIVPVTFGALGSAFGVGPVFWLSAAALVGTGWAGLANHFREIKHERR
jgi:MFS family permease